MSSRTTVGGLFSKRKSNSAKPATPLAARAFRYAARQRRASRRGRPCVLPPSPGASRNPGCTPQRYFRDSARRTGPPWLSRRWPEAPARAAAARIAGEHGVLLADQPEAGAVQHPPERRQFRRDRACRQHMRGLRPPDETLQRTVAEHRPAEGQPTQGAPGQLTVRLARAPRALGDDLVELPGVGDGAGSQRVPKASTELDAPRNSRGGRQTEQLRELGERACQTLASSGCAREAPSRRADRGDGAPRTTQVGCGRSARSVPAAAHERARRSGR